MKSLVLFLCVFSIGSALAEVKFSPRDVEPLAVGATIPDSELTKLNGSATTLSAAIGGKPSLLIFYRGGWCPYCNKHMAALKGVIPQVKEMGYEVIAISADFLESVKDAVAENDIDYTVLVDSSFELIQAFDLAFELDGPTMEKLASYDITVKPMPDSPIFILPVPAVYIVDKNGTVQYRHYDPDYTKRLHPEDLMQAIKSIK